MKSPSPSSHPTARNRMTSDILSAKPHNGSPQVARAAALPRFLFDQPDLSFDEQAHTVPGKINLRDVNVQMLRDFLQRPALDRAQVENLILLRADLALHARQRRV